MRHPLASSIKTLLLAHEEGSYAWLLDRVWAPAYH